MCETVTPGAVPGDVYVCDRVCVRRKVCVPVYLCLYVAVCKCMSVCLSGSVVYVCVCKRLGSVRWQRLERVSKLRRKSQWERRSYQKNC